MNTRNSYSYNVLRKKSKKIIILSIRMLVHTCPVVYSVVMSYLKMIKMVEISTKKEKK